MDKNLIAATLKRARDNSPKRNFKQSLDLVINLKGLDLKKPEHQVNMFIALHYNTGKDISVCALVDSDMESKAKEAFNETILLEQFEKFRGKAAAKKLAGRHDYFVAQASIMPKVAAVFGRYFGPRGKMPNPKIGSVLTPASNINQLSDRLKKTVLLATKNEPTIKCRVGNEDIKDEEAIDNIMTVYNNVLQRLPNDKQNIKSVMVKFTMGPSFVIGSKEQDGMEIGPENAKEGKKRQAKHLAESLNEKPDSDAVKKQVQKQKEDGSEKVYGKGSIKDKKGGK